MKRVVFVLVLMLAVSVQAANLINTGFENADGWADHVSGVWTQVANDGTWSANAYANTGATHGGSRKVGFNQTGRYLFTPSVLRHSLFWFESFFFFQAEDGIRDG